MKKSTLIKISAIIIVAAGLVVLLLLNNGIDLNLKEYQRISVNLDDYNGPTRVIDTSEDEVTVEKRYGIQIQDGTDYSQYSLVISKGCEVKKFTMFVFDHPNTCIRGDEKCSSIAICRSDLGKEYDNTIIVYSVRHKNIISSGECEETWF
jgi:hypothetical protein